MPSSGKRRAESPLAGPSTKQWPYMSGGRNSSDSSDEGLTVTVTPKHRSPVKAKSPQTQKLPTAQDVAKRFRSKAAGASAHPHVHSASNSLGSPRHPAAATKIRIQKEAVQKLSRSSSFRHGPVEDVDMEDADDEGVNTEDDIIFLGDSNTSKDCTASVKATKLPHQLQMSAVKAGKQKAVQQESVAEQAAPKVFGISPLSATLPAQKEYIWLSSDSEESDKELRGPRQGREIRAVSSPNPSAYDCDADDVEIIEDESSVERDLKPEFNLRDYLVLSDEDDDDNIRLPTPAGGTTSQLDLMTPPPSPEACEADLGRLLQENGPEDGLPMRSFEHFSLFGPDGGYRSLLKIPSNGFRLQGFAGELWEIPGDDPPSNPVNVELTELARIEPDFHSRDVFWILTANKGKHVAWYRLGKPSPAFAASFADDERYLQVFRAVRDAGFSLHSQLSLFRGTYGEGAVTSDDVEFYSSYLKVHMKRAEEEDAKIVNSKEPSPTFVTSKIFRTARPYFSAGVLGCIDGDIGENEVLQARTDEDAARQKVLGMMQTFRAMGGGRSDWSLDEADREATSDRYSQTYTAAFSPGFGTVRAGDHVFVAPVGHNEDPQKLPWIARIEYFHRIATEIVAHVVWQRFGVDSESFVKDVSSFFQLFQDDHCSDHPLDEFVEFANVVQLDDGDASRPPNEFYVQYEWDFHAAKFTDRALLDKPRATPLCDRKHRSCLYCERRLERHYFNKPYWRFLENRLLGFVYQEETYHIGDNVYVFMDEKTRFEVARLLSIDNCDGTDIASLPTLGKKSIVTVQYYRRRDDLLQDRKSQSSRELVLTNSFAAFNVSSLQGKADVRHAYSLRRPGRSDEERGPDGLNDVQRWSAFMARKDAFEIRDQLIAEKPIANVAKIFASPLDLSPLSQHDFKSMACKVCQVDHDHMDVLQTQHRINPLIGVDVFAGVGGAAEGFRQAGVEVVTAIESNFDAARMHKVNHPKTEVLQRDVNDVVKGFDLTRHGVVSSVAIPCPAKKVDIVFGSPPCGPHSIANGCKDPDDPRSNLALGLISVVEILSPSYALIENVTRFLHSPLSIPINGQRVSVKGGLVQLVVQLLLDANYQVQLANVNAKSYGVPQRRARLLITATKSGLAPMAFPLPSSVSDRQPLPIFHTGSTSARLAIGHGGAAPHRGTTFADVTTDLPRFSYVNPAFLAPLPSWENGKRSEDVLAEWDELHSLVFDEYARTPNTSYQEQMRVDPTRRSDFDLRRPSSQLTGHCVSRRVGEGGRALVERICNIPRNGNHLDLPPSLELETNKDGSLKNKSHYARIHHDAPLPTLICTVTPHGGGSGANIHSRQNRLISVREMSRGQSFKDTYIWSPELDKDRKAPQGPPLDVRLQYKLIGNALPPMMVTPIAEEMKKSWFKSLEQAKIEEA